MSIFAAQNNGPHKRDALDKLTVASHSLMAEARTVINSKGDRSRDLRSVDSSCDVNHPRDRDPMRPLNGCEGLIKLADTINPRSPNSTRSWCPSGPRQIVGEQPESPLSCVDSLIVKPKESAVRLSDCTEIWVIVEGADIDLHFRHLPSSCDFTKPKP